MDVRKDGWFGVLTVNGRTLTLGLTTLTRGTIMHLHAESLKALSAERSRPDAEGDIEILLRIRNKPIATDKDSLSQLNRAHEVDALLDAPVENDCPAEGESFDDFCDRLISSGYSRAAAIMVACAWFQREPDPLIESWLTDNQAIRFRELNTRDEAYAGALPNEYETLKHYVIQNYPSFVEGMTFRTA